MQNNQAVSRTYNPGPAKLIKRLAAFILDFIMVVIIVTGLLLLIFRIFKYDYHNGLLHDEYRRIGYEIFNETAKKYEYIKEDAPNIKEVMSAYNNSQVIKTELAYCNTLILNGPMFAIGVALLICELIIPFILRNGQTVGMKCFQIALLSNTYIKIKPIQQVIRGLFGKTVVLGLIPYLCFMYTFFTLGGIVGTIIILLVYGANAIMVIATKNHTGIADKMASVYAVDYTTTIFFKDENELADAIRKEEKINSSIKKVY